MRKGTSFIIIRMLYMVILGQNANTRKPQYKKMLPKTPNTKASGISYMGILSVAFSPDTIMRHILWLTSCVDAFVGD